MANKRLIIFSLICSVAPSSAWAAKTSHWLDLTSAQIAAKLDWTSTPDAKTVCQGYYSDKPIVTPPNATSKQTFIHANKAVLRQKKPNELVGNVQVTQIGRQITGNKAISYPDPKTNKAAKLDIIGNVHMRQPGFLAVSNTAHVNLKQKSTILNHTIFRYQMANQPRQDVYNAQHQIVSAQAKGYNYRGTALDIHRIKPQHTTLHDVSFTSCNPYSDAWHLSASTLKLNRKLGIGTSYNTVVWIHGVPVFYTPYLQFPIDNRRRSGFLTPNVNYTQNSGANISTPYYWNMAPNHDMTLTPNLISLRGVKLDDLYRYLDSYGSGQIYTSLLPNDTAYAAFKREVADGKIPSSDSEAVKALERSSGDRYEFGWTDKSQFSPYLQTNVNIDYVSDSNYVTDFPFAPMRTQTDIDSLVSNTQLTQSADATYTTKHWSYDANFENFQTMHPVDLTANPDQYARLPDINISGLYPYFWHDLNFDFSSEITNFAHPLLNNGYKTTLSPVTGFRYNFMPALDLYSGTAWGYVDPKITFAQTDYQLTDPAANPVNPALSQKPFMQRSLPIYDIDSGLYFDRTLDIAGSSFTQTLEPRLFYLNVPFVQQDMFPSFDTSLNPALTYDQLFATNRFQGFDRFGDANQMTLGVTSRFLKNSTGNDVLDLSIGRTNFFANRKVNSPDETPSEIANNTEKVSPILGQLSWQFKQSWNLTSNVAYLQQQNVLQNSSSSLTYLPDSDHYLSAGLTYVKDGEDAANHVALEQGNFGFVWPIGVHWHTIGGLVYNLSRKFSQTYLYGLQYNSCCWALRVISSRRYLGLSSVGNQPKYDNGIYLQFVLNGLTAGGVGEDGAPDQILQYALPGYNDTFGKSSYINNIR